MISRCRYGYCKHCGPAKLQSNVSKFTEFVRSSEHPLVITLRLPPMASLCEALDVLQETSSKLRNEKSWPATYCKSFKAIGVTAHGWSVELRCVTDSRRLDLEYDRFGLLRDWSNLSGLTTTDYSLVDLVQFPSQELRQDLNRRACNFYESMCLPSTPAGKPLTETQLAELILATNNVRRVGSFGSRAPQKAGAPKPEFDVDCQLRISRCP